MKGKTRGKRFVFAATGASGSIYLQRLLQHIDAGYHEVHVIVSDYAKQVAEQELGEPLSFSKEIKEHDGQSMFVPFCSGSTDFDAMVIVPCSMGTLGRVASGMSDGTIARAADVFLKEKRKLILVPRETPWNLIQARNVVTLMEAGATIMPACPSFYSHPKNIAALVDTVVLRICDHIGAPVKEAFRWKEGE